MKQLLIIMLLMTIGGIAYAERYYLYVRPVGQGALPDGNGGSNDSAVNSIFARYQVTAYQQSFPGAVDTGLVHSYRIYADGDIDALQDALTQTHLFSSVVKADFYTASCSAPYPAVNDLEITSGRKTNWALDKIDASCAWSITTGDPRVILAMADTDVDTFHEDMRNKFVYVWKADATSEYSMHGTKVMGIYFANTHNALGIPSIGHSLHGAGYRAASIWLQDRKTPPDDSTSASGDPWPAIWQAYLDGRRVINVSWSGIGATVAQVTEMTQHGAILVLAAGNDNAAKYHAAYANIPGVIVVSSTDLNDMHGTAPVHANNEFVDVCAPGKNVTTTKLNSRYHSSDATSIATPVVSGIVGLMLSVNPCLSPAEVEYVLKQTCDPVADNAAFPGEVGAGRVNAYKAVKMAQEMSCMNIKGIDINTLCRPGKIAFIAQPQFTVLMEGGTPPYIYK